jgi:hypothetical protein
MIVFLISKEEGGLYWNLNSKFSLILFSFCLNFSNDELKVGFLNLFNCFIIFNSSSGNSIPKSVNFSLLS